MVYLHIARGLYYGSYTKPRQMVWGVGVIILIAMMATAFIGQLAENGSTNETLSKFTPARHTTFNFK